MSISHLALVLSAAISGPQATAASVEPPSKYRMDTCVVTIKDEVMVPAMEQGVLVSLDATEGIEVSKDEMIAQLDDQMSRLEAYAAYHEYQAAQQDAESMVEVHLAEKGQKVAQAELDAAYEAIQKKERSLSDSELRKREFELQRADAQFEYAVHQKGIAKIQAQAQGYAYARAKAVLDRRKVKAPISGEVVEVFRHVGEWVNPGDPIAHIVRMDKLRVQGHAKVQDWARYDLVGRQVRIEVFVPGGQTETLQGVITYASPMTSNTGHYLVRAEIDNRKVQGVWLIQPQLQATMYIQDQPLAQR